MAAHPLAGPRSYQHLRRWVKVRALDEGGAVAKSELRKAGLKITHPRLKVLDILEQADPHHLSAEDVYKQLVDADESVGLATVYRVLTQFVEAGIVERHNFDDGRAVYEIAKNDHHDHMVDVDTGRVTEFVSEKIEALQTEIAKQHGYDIVGHELVLYVRKRTE
jgi:Fur family ferric uptake transcriptional regulator